jgi:hypothetical protein
MSARANIAIADGEASPVTHTFTPDGDLSEGVARYINFDDSPVLSETLTISVRDSNSSGQDYSIPGKKVSPRKVEMRLKMPISYVDSVSGLTLLDFTNEAVLTFNLHPRTSEQQAENLRKMVEDLMDGHANVTDAIEKGQRIW